MTVENSQTHPLGARIVLVHKVSWRPLTEKNNHGQDWTDLLLPKTDKLIEVARGVKVWGGQVDHCTR